MSRTKRCASISPLSLAPGMVFGDSASIQHFFTQEASRSGLAVSSFRFAQKGEDMNMLCRLRSINVPFTKKGGEWVVTEWRPSQLHHTKRKKRRTELVLTRQQIIEGSFEFPTSIRTGMMFKKDTTIFQALMEEAHERGLWDSWYSSHRSASTLTYVCKICQSKLRFSYEQQRKCWKAIDVNNRHDHSNAVVEQILALRTQRNLRRKQMRESPRYLKCEQPIDEKEPKNEEEYEEQSPASEQQSEQAKVGAVGGENEDSSKKPVPVQEVKVEDEEEPTSLEFLKSALGARNYDYLPNATEGIPAVLVLVSSHMKYYYAQMVRSSPLNFQVFHNLLSEPAGWKVGLFWESTTEGGIQVVGLTILATYQEHSLKSAIRYLLQLHEEEELPPDMMGSGRVDVSQAFQRVRQQMRIAQEEPIPQQAFDQEQYIAEEQESPSRMQKAQTDKKISHRTPNQKRRKTFHENCQLLLSLLRGVYQKKASILEFLLKIGELEHALERLSDTQGKAVESTDCETFQSQENRRFEARGAREEQRQAEAIPCLDIPMIPITGDAAQDCCTLLFRENCMLRTKDNQFLYMRTQDIDRELGGGKSINQDPACPC